MKASQNLNRLQSPRIFRKSVEACRLYAILDTAYLAGRDPTRVAFQMIEGGVDIIQVRAKDLSFCETFALTKAIWRITHSAAIPLIINDHPAVAAEMGVEGVHVGQGDMPVSEIRRMMKGRKCWVGKSTHSLQQALAAEAEGVDYIGVGPIFATPTKPGASPVGLDLVRKVSSRLKTPFFCIGGIKRENAKEVLLAGTQRLAVVSGILQAPDVTAYCRDLKRVLETGRIKSGRRER